MLINSATNYIRMADNDEADAVKLDRRRQVRIALLGFGGGGGGGEMMGGEGEGAHRATFFLLAYWNYWGNS
jgi:hypothetical protein